MGKKALSEKEIRYIAHLRERGHSLPEIRSITGHGQGTVFKYIQGIKILPGFQEYWNNKRKSSIARMLLQQERANKQAKKLLSRIEMKEKALIAACLYWAEGSKGDLSLSNTDPALIKTFVDGLKELGIRKERLSMNLRIYEDLDQKKVCNFWSKVVGIPKERIMYVDVLKGKKKGRLRYGMCRVRVIKGAYFLKLLNSLVDIIKNNTVGPCSSTDRTRVS